jgi:hypothetical protein
VMLKTQHHSFPPSDQLESGKPAGPNWHIIYYESVIFVCLQNQVFVCLKSPAKRVTCQNAAFHGFWSTQQAISDVMPPQP